MNFVTQFNFISDPPEVNEGKCIVEKAGYIPTKHRIENMILAGQRLVAYRASQFDFATEQDIDENFDDVTRRQNFDLADASMLINAINDRFNSEEVQNTAQSTAQDESSFDVPDQSS